MTRVRLSAGDARPAGGGTPQAARETTAYANVIGRDPGPTFTLIGSLARLLWLPAPARKGSTMTWGQYMKVGLVITPPGFLAAMACWLPLARAS